MFWDAVSQQAHETIRRRSLPICVQLRCMHCSCVFSKRLVNSACNLRRLTRNSGWALQEYHLCPAECKQQQSFASKIFIARFRQAADAPRGGAAGGKNPCILG